MSRTAPPANPRGWIPPRHEVARPARIETHIRHPGGFRLKPEMLAGLAILLLASVSMFGQLAVLLFIAGSVALVALQPLKQIKDIVRFSPLLLLPVLAILSTIWSDAPEQSMRAGLELLLTFAAAIVICRSSNPQTMILALFVSTLWATLTLIPYIPQSLATKQALVAWMGSKNQVGIAGNMLFTLGLGIIFNAKQHWLIRLIAIGALPFAILLMYLSQSGGTTSTILLTLLVFPPLAMLSRFNLPIRISLSLLAVCLLVVAGIFSQEINAEIANFRQTVLNKDATLTGRTYLWDFALRLASVRPTWGYGYGAFWRQGNIDAEGLWRWGGIPNRSGFNFHNAYLEMRVGLGYVGFAVLIGTSIFVTSAALLRQVLRPSVSFACLIGMTLVMYVRSYVEDGLAAPFSMETVIWLATGIYAFAPMMIAPKRDASAPRERRGQVGSRRRIGPLYNRDLRDTARSGQDRL